MSVMRHMLPAVSTFFLLHVHASFPVFLTMDCAIPRLIRSCVIKRTIVKTQ
jgi:hypothetical protein